MADELVDAATNSDGGTVTPAAEAVKPDVAAAAPETETKAADAAAEPKEEGAKGDEASKPDVKPEIPEVYEFKAPEGTTLDEGAIALVTPVLKKHGITQEGAQEFAEVFAQIQVSQAAAQKEAWTAELMSDPKLGGKEYENSKALAQSAFAKFGSPELKQFLEDTGLGNHKEFVRAFVEIAKASQQDKHVSAGAGTGDLTPAQRLFPNTK